MKLLFALSGLHRVDRGAEQAFIAIGNGLVKRGHQVVLAGSGEERPGAGYSFVRLPSFDRKKAEKLPQGPLFRNETAYEDLTFAAALLAWFKPSDFDITLTCSYPYTNWVLRRPAFGRRRPAHVFVTENGDWPARAGNAEYRLFGCDGLVCINPDFFEFNKSRWNCALIPNGVDSARYSAAKRDRARFGLPENSRIVLMVSALIETKRVVQAIEAISRAPDWHLAVAGDGPDREKVHSLARQKLEGRFSNFTVSPKDMPALYASADIFLHMSLFESFGNVFLEAMAAGVPIIGHESSRLRWIVGDHGHLVDTENLDAVTEKLLKIQPPDESNRKAYQEAAARFDWSNVSKQYEHFLESLIRKRS